MVNTSVPPAQPKARTYSGVSAEERTRLRRDKLLEAATDVFGEEGYAQTTMRNICVRARLAERYFYESFDSTLSLFEEVYRREVEGLINRMGEAFAAAPVGDRAFVEAGMRAFLQFIKDDPRRVQIVLIDGVWMDQMRAREGRSDLVGYGNVIRSLTQGFHPDMSEEINVDMAASGLIGLAIHTAIEWARHDFEADLESVLRHNLFAWGGLGYWAKALNRANAKPEGERIERRAWSRRATDNR